jgi:glycosyltransferase involved in cell wall biosynthesis
MDECQWSSLLIVVAGACGPAARAMKFSLILATVGRTSQPACFLAALDRQICRDFELIVVDQNPDDRLGAILEPYAGKFEVTRLRSAPGVSRARNVGLAAVSGQVVGFPDDDCWYAAGLLEDLNAIFEARAELAVVCGRMLNPAGLPWRRMPPRSGRLNRYNLFRRTLESAIFIRREISESVGPFDETFGLGAGTPWTGSEGEDYVIRALKLGARAEYRTDIGVYHAEPLAPTDPARIAREYAASRSFTRVLRKHNYPRWFVGYLLGLSVAGALVSVARGDRARIRHYRRGFEAKLLGWRDRGNPPTGQQSFGTSDTPDTPPSHRMRRDSIP